MSVDPDILVSITGVQKAYNALRPLRVKELHLRRGETTALVGVDQPMAEVLVGLITGAILPDAGDVMTFGRLTRSIESADSWVELLDRFGLVSDRAVLLEQMSVEQNLAMPYSLEIDELPGAVQQQVAQLAAEVGLPAGALPQPVAGLSADGRLRVRLGRALALNPAVLLAEHVNATLAGAERRAFTSDFVRIAAARRLAALILTADVAFAQAIGSRVLTLQPATGELRTSAGWRRWWSNPG